MNKLYAELISKLVVLGLIVAAMLLGRRARNKMRDKRGRLPAVVDGRKPGKPVPVEGATKGEQTHEGITYEYEYHPGEEGVPSYFVLTIVQQTEGDFLLSKTSPKRLLGRWLKRRGITYVRSGDEMFDNRFDVVTDATPAFATACLRSAEARVAVEWLFSTGATLLRNDGKGIDAIWTEFARPKEDLPATIKDAASPLRALIERCATFRPSRVLGISVEKWGWPGACAVPAAAFLAVFVAMAVLMKTNAKHVDEVPIAMGLLVTLPVLVPWLFISYRMVKGRGNSVGYIPAVWGFSVLTFWMAGSTWFLALNSALDRSPPSRCVQPILAIAPTETGSGYDVDVVSWRPGKDVQRIFVSHAESRQDPLAFHGRQALEIRTKPGFFGYQWICSVKPVFASDAKRQAQGSDAP